MRNLRAAIIVGSLALIGSPPATAGEPAASNASTQSTVGNDAAVDRASFLQQTRNEVEQWRTKLQAFCEKVATAGNEVGKTAASDLERAWARTQTASRRLQTAGDEGWESAKASYDKASRDLASTWRKLDHRE